MDRSYSREKLKKTIEDINVKFWKYLLNRDDK
jgi:hypothetical protein